MNSGNHVTGEIGKNNVTNLAAENASDPIAFSAQKPTKDFRIDKASSKDVIGINRCQRVQAEKDIETSLGTTPQTSCTGQSPLPPITDTDRYFEKQQVVSLDRHVGNEHVSFDFEKHNVSTSSARHVESSDASFDLEKQNVSTSSRMPPKEDGDLASTAEPQQQDSDIVDWDGPDDPENPMNWPSARRWGMIAVVSGITFLTPLGSSMFAPGVPLVMADFHSTNELLAGFVVSVYVLGFACGPLGGPNPFHSIIFASFAG